MTTISDVITDYLLACRTLSPRTSVWYDHKLKRFAQWTQGQGVTDVTQLKAVHLRQYQDWLLMQTVSGIDPSKPQADRPLSPYTVRGSVQVIKGWARWAVDEGYLGADPFTRVKRPREPQTVIEVFTADHLHALLAACPRHTPQGMRDRAILLVLLDTGLRASEMVGLTLDRLHLQDRDPWLEVAWQTSKGRKAREVGLGTEATRALLRYLRQGRPALASTTRRREVPTAIWLNRFGQPLTRNGLDQALYELRNRAGVTGVRVSAHTFRHTFAVAFLKATGDVYRLSKLLGHSSVAVTEHYLRAFRARDARGEGTWVSPAQLLLSGK